MTEPFWEFTFSCMWAMLL